MASYGFESLKPACCHTDTELLSNTAHEWEFWLTLKNRDFLYFQSK